MATGMIEHLKKQLILKRFTFGYGGSISAGAGKRLLPSDVGYSIPAGYHPVGITCFATGSSNLVLDYLQPQYNSDQTTNYFVAVKNVHASSSASTNSAIAEILFAPEWMVQIIDSDEPVKPTGDIMREPVFKIKNFTSAYSISSGGAKAFTRSGFDFFVPEGYEIFSLRNFSSGGYRVSISDADPFNPNRMMTIRNTYSSAVNNITAELGVVFINRKFMLPDTRKGLIVLFNEASSHHELDKCVFQNQNSPYNEITAISNLQYLPSTYPSLVNNEFNFFMLKYYPDEGISHRKYPQKVEVISGSEYINFLNSTCYDFIIPEDFTDRQIILKFTFD